MYVRTFILDRLIPHRKNWKNLSIKFYRE